ncbi:DUF1080 domain-containing protein [Rubripirellula sp.]|nr:family 16 glycoside hydrolase [Rubripirellula sp.]MDB4694950.1 DUF1080 domain-containing protein [bacterium]MDB4749564.1 DUF1080 domain-containing protein [Rubripirellula sp.]
MMRIAFPVFALLVCLCSVVESQVYDTPEKASEDADFALQGEYTDSTRGLQAIALGDGEFRVVVYTDGLPGAGWNGKDKQELELDADQLESMVSKFKRLERKSPTLGVEPPVGSVVLFDGTPEALKKHWKDGARITDDGLLMEGCTSIDKFGDYSMHLEFRLPFMPKARGQGRGNSGLYHQGRYETQVLDSFGLEGKNNETGGLYSIKAPDLNMCLPPMAWQTYDVDFTAARFDAEGKKTANAKITVKLNGVVVHRDVELPRTTTAAPVKEAAEPGPIYLQNHGNPVRFRNIWVRPRDVAAEARRPIVPGFERFHANGGDAAVGGRLLIGELNCVGCHEAGSGSFAGLSSKQPPLLDKIGERVHPEWLVDFIANPHDEKPGTTMPDLMSGMAAEQRKEAALAIANFLVGGDAIQLGGKTANTGQGERVFHEAGCVACHLPRDGRKASADTSVPLVGLDKKYSRASLEKFLKDPLAVRPSGRMPQLDLGGDNWRHVAQYLTGDDAGVAFGSQRDLPKEPNMKFSAYFRGVDKMPDLEKLDADKTGVSRGLDIGVGGRNENVIISYEGFLPITKAGKYSFRLSSDDGSMLYLDGRKLIDNDGVHPNTAKEASIDLEPGMHAIRVNWFEKGGEEVLALDWAGPGVKSGGIDKAIVMTADGVSVPVEQEVVKADPDKFVFDPSLVGRGRELFSSLGCAACHLKTDQGKPVPSDVTAPKLVDCSAGKGCLSAGTAAMIPNYELTPIQQTAVETAIRQAAKAGDKTAASEAILDHSMAALNCYACHQRDGKGGPESDRNPLFVSTIPEMGDEGRLPPPLDGAGDKLREDWLNRVIGNGDKSRPYMKTYMPKFGNENAKAMASHFSTLDSITDANLVDSGETETRKAAFGRQMVGSKGLACVSCHTYGKFKSTGIQAIALDTMTQRIREDWFHRYLPNPQKYRPGTRMPTGYPEGKSTVANVYDGNRDLQLAAMWAFLKKGANGGVPEGIVNGMIELKADNKPVIYRNFIEGVTPRGIAVGYPERANLCWDANRMALAVVWQDRFIDASKHWEGRGQGNQTPLGGNVAKFESVAPVAVLQNLETAWPDGAPKERGYRFLGYRLDQQGRPTFRYRFADAEVDDTPLPVAGDFSGTFERIIKVTPTGQQTESGIYFRAGSGNIEALEDGWFLLNDLHRIRITTSGKKPFVRKVGGSSEILVPVNGSTVITQEIVW